jgi:hypothetical protein
VTDENLRRRARELSRVTTMLGHYSDDLIATLASSSREPTPALIARVSAQRHRLQHASLLINQARTLVLECRATTEETTT